MASPVNKEFSQSERKVATVEEVTPMTSGRDTLTVDPGNNILGTYLKDMANGLFKRQSCLM